MFRNYFAAALRNLARNRFYSAISITGLSMGLCALLLTGLVIRNQMSYDHFIPGYERTYLAASALIPTDRVPYYDTHTPSWIAPLLKLKFHEIEAIARLADQDLRLRKGNIEATEKIYWADPNAFDVLPLWGPSATLTAASGDLRTALQRPDGIVLTRSMARKYFGREDSIGETILVAGSHPMTVTAVIADLPVAGTQLESGIFASGLASYSLLTQLDNDTANTSKGPGVSITCRTYLRLARSASVLAVQSAMPDFVKGIFPPLPPGVRASFELIRIDRVNLFPQLNPGVRSRLTVMALIGLLILVIACVVFVNLSTARSTRRALEVGIRKVSGASRWAIIVQFLGESLIHVMLATCIAIALTELLLPYVNAFLDAGASIAYWHEPQLLVYLATGMLTVTLLAGAYPAFILSGFRPIDVLHKSIHESGGAYVRQSLVALQFAALVGLLIAAAVVYRQRDYATQEALRINADQILIVRSPCRTVFMTELRQLPGVRGAHCSSETLLTGASFGNYKLKDGSVLAVGDVPVDFGIFGLYGLTPVAGQFPQTQDDATQSPNGIAHYVVNETAVRRFGFPSASAAIGQPLPLAEAAENVLSLEAAGNVIVGVVADFSIASVEHPVISSLYYANSRAYSVISVKLTGHEIPETLGAIDRLWATIDATKPIDRFFLNDYIQNLYTGLLREAQAFGVFSGVAVLLACLGLVGLSASSTERRTKEIGIRKVMGARTGDIVRLLVWQFIKPVLWANVIAWPVAALLMSRWLRGFAYHVDLELWPFLAASSLALLSALLTVGLQSHLVARDKPVAALRYE
jgi:putative ABC transport system permease protein